MPRSEAELMHAWQEASGQYALVVASRGTGTAAARQEWAHAKEVLDELVAARTARLSQERCEEQHAA
jgi:hypothetical protein